MKNPIKMVKYIVNALYVKICLYNNNDDNNKHNLVLTWNIISYLSLSFF